MTSQHCAQIYYDYHHRGRMADEELPSDYDAIILGTGMTECILAAGLSRIGQRVLHLDRNEYYCGDWATFHLEALQKWIRANQGESEALLKVKEGLDPQELLGEGEHIIPLEIHSKSITNLKQHIYIPEKLPEKVILPQDKPDSSIETESSIAPDSSGTEQGGQDSSTTNTESDNVKTESQDDCKPAEQEVVSEPTDGEPSENVQSESSEHVQSESSEHVQSGPPADREDSQPQTVIEKQTKEEQESEKKEWSWAELMKNWRHFNIDLMPKVLYCRGPMVELLISSDIAKYCEFRTVTRVLTLLNGKLETVPCSRSDVFSSKQVSMIEKRMMMKLLTSSMEYDKHPEDYAGYEDKTFDQFLQSKKLTENVKHFVKHAIAMVTDDTGTLEGLSSNQHFLQSLGRYGNTAFLWPLYGSGELPQCFCRMCAVFGGIYCLRRTGHSLVTDQDNVCKGIVDTEGQKLNAKWVIMEASYASPQLLPQLTPRREISRAILMTDRSLLKDKTEHTSLLRLPSGDGLCGPVTVYELSTLSMACPKQFHIIHLTCTTVKEAETDLSPRVSQLFQLYDPDSPSDSADTRPQVLWSLYYNMIDTTQGDLSSGCPGNTYIVGGPDNTLDFNHAIEEAKKIFDQLCPGEEFLPRAPDPEDIIYDEGENKEQKASGFEVEEDGTAKTEEPAAGEGKGTAEGEEDNKKTVEELTEGGGIVEDPTAVAEEISEEGGETEGGTVEEGKPEKDLIKPEKQAAETEGDSGN